MCAFFAAAGYSGRTVKIARGSEVGPAGLTAGSGAAAGTGTAAEPPDNTPLEIPFAEAAAPAAKESSAVDVGGSSVEVATGARAGLAVTILLSPMLSWSFAAALRNASPIRLDFPGSGVSVADGVPAEWAPSPCGPAMAELACGRVAGASSSALTTITSGEGFAAVVGETAGFASRGLLVALVAWDSSR